MTVGYIYIREHESYDKYNACKIGITTNIPDRENVYITNEIKKGEFTYVFEVKREQMRLIENLIHQHFRVFHIRYNGGTEFFRKNIVVHLEPYFKYLGIEYRLLEKREISHLLRRERVKKNFRKVSSSFIQYSKGNYYTPRDYQKEIITSAVKYYTTYNKGLLVLPCGVGKTLISLWITKELHSHRILIGVPSIELIEQWISVLASLFQGVPIYKVYSKINVDDIIHFLKSHALCIVLTTYSSCYKIKHACRTSGISFDMKIHDETHHLTRREMEFDEEKKLYIKMLDIPSKKDLSLTATLKGFEDGDETMISNHDEIHFGKIIDKKSLLWAIKREIVCDYSITTLVTEEEDMDIYFSRFSIREEIEKRLFLSAYASLLTLLRKKSHHLLIYCNTVKHSNQIITYIHQLLEYFSLDDFYYASYHSNLHSRERKDILHEFMCHTRGILTCVYCLGEGWDLPILDGVVFSENMSSTIRIVQSALRGIRKDRNDPTKECSILLPVLNVEEWTEKEENVDFKKVKEVIYQMGLEDETIEQKIKVYRIQPPQKHTHRNDKEGTILTEFGEYDEELTKRIRLRTLHRNELYPRYEKMKSILSKKNIQSTREYYKLCETDIRLPKDPKSVYRSSFKGWIDYLGIERKYYDIHTCKNRIQKYLRAHREWNKNRLDLSYIAKQLKSIDANFPPYELWVEYYDVDDLRELIKIKSLKKKTLVL